MDCMTCEDCRERPATRTYVGRRLCADCEERAVGYEIDAWSEYLETDGPWYGPDADERAALRR